MESEVTFPNSLNLDPGAYTVIFQYPKDETEAEEDYLAIVSVLRFGKPRIL